MVDAFTTQTFHGNNQQSGRNKISNKIEGVDLNVEMSNHVEAFGFPGVAGIGLQSRLKHDAAARISDIVFTMAWCVCVVL